MDKIPNAAVNTEQLSVQRSNFQPFAFQVGILEEYQFLNHYDPLSDYTAHYESQNVEKDAEVKNRIMARTKVTSLFEELGYDLNEKTTYYYRDFVVAATQYLQKNNQEEAEYELVSQIKNPQSRLYYEVAKDEYDMPLRTFHTLINKVYDEANHKNVNQLLAREIYDGVPKSMEENTLLIASFVSRQLKEEKATKNESQYTEKSQIRLKTASY